MNPLWHTCRVIEGLENSEGQSEPVDKVATGEQSKSKSKEKSELEEVNEVPSTAGMAAWGL